MKRQGSAALGLVGSLLLACLAGCALFGPGTTAVIGVDVTSGTVPLTMAFDGTGSTGTDGISTYHWAFGNGDESYEASGTYTYEQAGTFTLSLTVRAEDGKTVTETVDVIVQAAMWVTDENLDQVYRLSLDGTLLDTFALPAKEPRGVAVAVANGQATLVVACANEGFQKILYLDPATGALRQTKDAPAQSPEEVTYGATGQKMLWLVDGQSRIIYRMNPDSAQVFDAFGQTYFKATSLQVRDVPFLRTPEGLDWVAETNAPGYLYYLEGDTHVLWKIRIVPGYDIMANTQLSVEGTGTELPSTIFPVSAIDIYDGKLWAVDGDRHRIVEMDLATGELTGNVISSFPGAAPAGLEIQF
jgi:PKD repeat protein